MKDLTACVVVRTGAEDATALAEATGLAEPSVASVCRPLVIGLLSVIDDPAVGVVAGSPRHAHVRVELLAPAPLDVDLQVTASLRRAARLGAADGLWIDVDVDGPGGGVLRSRHVVAADLNRRPQQRGSLPKQHRRLPGAEAAGSFSVTRAVLAAYRQAAADTSPAHQSGRVDDNDDNDEGDTGFIVPGLLSLLGSVAVLPGSVTVPTELRARFLRPLPVGAAAEVAFAPNRGERAWTVTAGDPARTVLAATATDLAKARTRG